MNLDEQYLIKAHKQMLEQAEKDVDTALFQRTEQSQKDAIEQAEKFGLFAQMKEIEELAKLMTPQLFQSLNSEQQEDVIKVTEAISEPDIKPEEATKKIKELENELASAHNIIKQQRKDKKDAGAEALAIRRNKPATKDEMVAVIDRNRKLNGKCNNEAIARELGWKDGGTIKKWIEGFKLSDYAYNPDRIATFNRKKK